MRVENPGNVKIGDWYTSCCIIDLLQIVSAADLVWVADHLREYNDDPDEALSIRVWDSRESALRELSMEESH